MSTLLTRLEKRGLVTHRPEGRTFVYRALLSESAVRRSTIRSVLRDVFRDDPSALLSQLVSQHDLDAAELASMKRLLAEAGSPRAPEAEQAMTLEAFAVGLVAWLASPSP